MEEQRPTLFGPGTWVGIDGPTSLGRVVHGADRADELVTHARNRPDPLLAAGQFTQAPPECGDLNGEVTLLDADTRPTRAHAGPERPRRAMTRLPAGGWRRTLRLWPSEPRL